MTKKGEKSHKDKYSNLIKFSPEDRELFERHGWNVVSVCRNRYLRARVNGKTTSFHRLILSAPKGMQVDHINGDGLDNRRENLRLVSSAENCRAFRKKKVGASSKYRGVRRNRARWEAAIVVSRRYLYLGSFSSEEGAARAYDKAAAQYFGSFAQPNFLGAETTFGSLVYLAVPYSDPDPEIRQKRFHIANRVAGALMKKGELVFSPISSSHAIAEETKLPGDWAYWEKFDRVMLERSQKLVVVCIPGWKASVGVTAEIAIAKELGLPVQYIRL